VVDDDISTKNLIHLSFSFGNLSFGSRRVVATLSRTTGMNKVMKIVIQPVVGMYIQRMRIIMKSLKRDRIIYTLHRMSKKQSQSNRKRVGQFDPNLEYVTPRQITQVGIP